MPKNEASPIRYERFFNPQGLEKKTPKTLDENIADGLRGSYLIFNKDLSRWDIIGPGTNKISACLKIDEEKTMEFVSSGLKNIISIQKKQVELWISRNTSSDRHDYYHSFLSKLLDLDENYTNSRPVEVALALLQNPDYDHDLDMILVIQKND